MSNTAISEAGSLDDRFVNAPYVLAMASAGSGKTYRLAMAYLGLLARGAETGDILACTFTRKAAAEILERVLRFVVEAATDAERLAEVRARAEPSLTAARCREIAVRVARSLHRAQVMTLDAFAARAAGGLSLGLGTPPGWRVLDPAEATELRAEAMARVTGEAGFEVLLGALQAYHQGDLSRRVLETGDDLISSVYSAFVAAGADPEIWRFPVSGVPLPDDDEVSALIDRLRSLEAPLTKAGKPNSKIDSALCKLVSFVEAGDWSGVLCSKLAAAASGEGRFAGVPLEPDFADVIAEAHGHAAVFELDRLAKRNAAAAELLTYFHAAYLGEKRRRGVVEFDDLPRLLAAGSVRTDDLYYRLDGRIKHLLLDEFQDTSRAQFEMLRPLLDEKFSRGEGERVFIVGDTKQSLYGWRQAEPGIMHGLPDRYPGLDRIPLQVSFRSSPVVLGAVNTVFDRCGGVLVERGGGALVRFAGAFPAHEAARGNSRLPGRVVLREYAVDDSEPGPAGEEADGLRAMSEAAADAVRRIREASPHASIGVLTRRNAPIASLLHRIGGEVVNGKPIAVAGERGVPFGDIPATAAVLSVLHLMDHPGDGVAAYHAAVSPLGRALGLAWRYTSKGVEPGSLDAALRPLRYLLADHGLPAVVSRLCELARREACGDAAWALDRLVAASIRLPETSRVQAGLAAAALEQREADSGAQALCRVMTVHQAKGLEFDAVVLVDLDSSWSVDANTPVVRRAAPFAAPDAATLYPKQDLIGLHKRLREVCEAADDEAVEANLCALYVAMTRARRWLEMLVPPAPRNPTALKASRLLRETLADPTGRDDGLLHLSGVSEAEAVSGITPVESAEGTREQAAIRLASRPAPVHRLPASSPSGLEGEGGRTAADLLNLSSSEALSRGTLWHLWFEHIAWLEEGADGVLGGGESGLSAAGLVRLAADGGLAPGPEAASAEAAAFVGVLSDPAVSGVLRRWRYAGDAEPQRERPFTVIDVAGERRSTLTGCFDRLVVGKGPSGEPVWAEIIDWKTDDVTTEAEVSARVVHYTPQVSAYRRAAGRLLGLPEDAIGVSLVFTTPRRVVELHPCPGLAG